MDRQQNDTPALRGLDTNKRIERALLGAFIGAFVGFLFFIVLAIPGIPLGAWLGWRTGDPDVLAKKAANKNRRAMVFRCRDEQAGFLVHFPTGGPPTRFKTLEGARKLADEYNAGRGR